MATSEVSKYSVYDPRVVQTKPKYAVEKGALSITNVSFNAQTANATSQQFNVIVPSENVFIDRAVDWVSGGVASIALTLSAAAGTNTGTTTAGLTLASYGDFSLAAFPNHQCVSQMTATINDATVTVNTQDVLNQVLRLQDLAKHRRQRTCPTMLDKYAIEQAAGVGYAAGTGTAASAVAALPNSPLGGYGAAYEPDAVPNGAWTQWWFCNSDGSVGTSSSTSITPSVNALGLPVATSTGTAQTIYIRWQSTEKLLLPPFIFGDAYELSTGLFGVQNFQVQMNMAPTPSRAIRVAQQFYGKAIGIGTSTGTWGISTSSGVGVPTWNTSAAGSYPPYPLQPALSVQFLTPALDVPLPPKSIVPYMEFPRYITTGLSAIPATLGSAPNAKGVTSGSTVLSSNTITLPNIPDMLMIYLKPQSADSAMLSAAPFTGAPTTFASVYGDFTLPIEAISINFDNFSGLLANHTQFQLYKMSVNNGLEMDFNEWNGEARTTLNGVSASPYISLAGGPLVLRPGRDFALQAGQAPGLVGNFTLQFNITVGNQFAQSIAAGGVNLYVVPISSGFFETIKGSSRIIKGVLTEQDILSAPPHAPDEALERKVGAGKHMSKKHHMSADAIYG
jgi:hypothetical protein